MAWLDWISYPRLIVNYIYALFALFFLSIFAFFFPIMPLYSAMGWEFSNLGPIATAFWGVAIDLYGVTPAFIGLLAAKLIRSATGASKKLPPHLGTG